MSWNDNETLTPQNLNSKTGLVFNVKDADFGATGDGTTDDTTAIQDALSAATLAGGGTVYIPPGTYLVSSTISVGTNTNVEGAGIGSVLTSGAGSSGYNGIQGIFTAQSADSISFRKMSLHNTNVAGGIYTAGCNSVIIDDCHFSQLSTVVGTMAAPLEIRHDPDSSASNITYSGFNITNNHLAPGSTVAMQIVSDSASTQVLENLVVTGNVIDASGSPNIFGSIKLDEGTRNWIIADNTIDGGGILADAITIDDGCSFGVIKGNMISNISRTGILMDEGDTNEGCQQIVISNNIFDNIDGSASDGIRTVNASSRFTSIVITNNVFHDISRNAFQENSSSSIVGLIIANNSMESTGGITLRSPNVIVNGNWFTNSAESLACITFLSSASTCIIVNNVCDQIDSSSQYFDATDVASHESANNVFVPQ